MNNSENDQSVTHKPVIKQKQWPYPLIWILPILCLGGAALYARDYLADKGPEISLEFSDASGLRENESRIMYRGANVGKVTDIELTDDHKKAIVKIRLNKREDIFASKGAEFWIVRPEISQEGLSGLGTLFSGPYIAGVPGKGEEDVSEFVGMTKAPKPFVDGERFILTTSKMGHVQEGSAVYYKGAQVGEVQNVELAREADHMDVSLLVYRKYAPLVRTTSKFWVVSGLSFNGGLFSGASLRLDSMKALVSGGVAFATSEKDLGQDARPGTTFALADEPKKEWDTWSPKISIGGPLSKVAKKPATANAIELPTAKQEKEKK